MLSAALQHPHIVPVLSAGETAATTRASATMRLPFFIMPFVEGESLRARLVARAALGPRGGEHPARRRARARSMRTAAASFTATSSRTTSCCRAASATVTDFGVAKAHHGVARGASRRRRQRSGTITLVGTSIGTPAYMAPEQAAGDPNTDHRADLYALGIVGYEMLVGTPPFHGRAPQQLLAAQLTEAPPPIGSRRYDVPRRWRRSSCRLLEKDPAKRPRTATEVARALEDPSVVSGTFTSAQPREQRRSRSA